MVSAIAENLDQFQAESNQSNDFHRRRATVDYIPKAHSKLPFNYAQVAVQVRINHVPANWSIVER